VGDEALHATVVGAVSKAPYAHLCPMLHALRSTLRPDPRLRIANAEIALVHLHLKTWWALNEAKRQRTARSAARGKSLRALPAHLSQPLMDSEDGGGVDARAAAGTKTGGKLVM